MAHGGVLINQEHPDTKTFNVFAHRAGSCLMVECLNGVAGARCNAPHNRAPAWASSHVECRVHYAGAVTNSSGKSLQNSAALGFRGQVRWLHLGAHSGMGGSNAEMGLAALGFAFGCSNGKIKGAGTTTDLKSWFLGPYGTWKVGPLTLDGDLSCTYSQGAMSGRYSIPVADSTSGHFHADNLSGNLKASHVSAYDDGALRLIPSIGVEAVYIQPYSFNEGGSSTNRDYAASSMHSVGIPVGADLQRAADGRGGFVKTHTASRRGLGKIISPSGVQRAAPLGSRLFPTPYANTMVLLPSTSTRSSRCQRTARESTWRSMSRPRILSSSSRCRCDTRMTSCSMMGPLSRRPVT